MASTQRVLCMPLLDFEDGRPKASTGSNLRSNLARAAPCEGGGRYGGQRGGRWTVDGGQRGPRARGRVRCEGGDGSVVSGRAAARPHASPAPCSAATRAGPWPWSRAAARAGNEDADEDEMMPLPASLGLTSSSSLVLRAAVALDPLRRHEAARQRGQTRRRRTRHWSLGAVFTRVGGLVGGLLCGQRAAGGAGRGAHDSRGWPQAALAALGLLGCALAAETPALPRQPGEALT